MESHIFPVEAHPGWISRMEWNETKQVSMITKMRTLAGEKNVAMMWLSRALGPCTHVAEASFNAAEFILWGEDLTRTTRSGW